MRIPRRALEALGALGRKLQDPRWVVEEGAKAVAAIYVIGPNGQKIQAYLSHHLFDSDKPTGLKGYKDHAGNEYFEMNGSRYYYDHANDAWKRA